MPRIKTPLEGFLKEKPVTIPKGYGSRPDDKKSSSSVPPKIGRTKAY